MKQLASNVCFSSKVLFRYLFSLVFTLAKYNVRKTINENISLLGNINFDPSMGPSSLYTA